MYLNFDTETTGLPKDHKAPVSQTDNWPRVVQIAWQLHDDMGRLIEHRDFIIKPEDFNIPFEAEQVHGISTELAMAEGEDLEKVLYLFNEVLDKAKFVVGHNIDFDRKVLGAEYYRKNIPTTLFDKKVLDTMTEKTAELCQLPGGKHGKKFKKPKLGELYRHLFGEDFVEAHNATADVEATVRIFFELLRQGHFTARELETGEEYLKKFKKENPETIRLVGLNHVNFKQKSAELRQKSQKTGEKTDETEKVSLSNTAGFSHLHNHTQFSVLQSTTVIEKMVQKAGEMQMPGVAITDTNNLMGAFYFVSAVEKYNKDKSPDKQLKALVGVELNVVDDHTDKTVKDKGYPTIFIAKNKQAYHNLVKLVSAAHTEGFYYVPRIGRDWVKRYKEGLIVLSGSLSGEIAQKILRIGDKQAEEAVRWWHGLFGDDYYLELNRHGLEEEEHVNKVLLDFANKYGIKVVAANNTYYLEQQDADIQDVLICIRDNEKKSTPIGRGRGFRYGLPNDEFYFKSQEQMQELFKDIPEAIANTKEIVDKVENYSLKRDILLPEFDIPEEFKDPLDAEDGGQRGENAYLRHLTFEGAKKRWKELTPEIKERLEYELDVIKLTKYPGYFLIVHDIIKQAKNMGVVCGPGRGSAAGSAVAYALQITNVDPLKYNLLFERFLNPERISMPDIDMDFDDEGREYVIDYVLNKYGKERVAQIITYGTMAARSSMRDAARVLELPLHQADVLAKKTHVPLSLIVNRDIEKIKKELENKQEKIEDSLQLSELAQGDDLVAKTIHTAAKIEGSIRNLGLHACGFIIAPTNLEEVIPITSFKRKTKSKEANKDENIFVTQFDNAVVEAAGLLKMDFLGIKTLTIIRDTLRIIKQRHGIDIDIDNIPFDDETTYRLFQNGQTITVFQFESDGMRKSLKKLRPTELEDLIAMVALYRPGPMEKIPNYVARKYGEEPVTYDLPEMEEILKTTYGITIYQEQVMLLSQKLAGFTRGQADNLRKAMGKKDHKLLAKMKPLFIEGAKANGHPEDVLEKIWNDWRSFASYAFNRSHAVSYAIVAYQTAYLKANYPSEYMAAVLSHNLKDSKKLTFMMMEARKMGIKVLPPDINESDYLYTVNKEGNIRYGLGGASGVGSKAVEAIIKEREENGPYKSIFDFVKRVDLRKVNKRTIENLVKAGAFDCFEGVHRAQYFQESNGTNLIEKAIKFGNRYKKDKEAMQTSLFGDSEEVQISEPEIPYCEPWTELQKLEKEKEVAGIYLSGHPLDLLKVEYKYYVKHPIRFVNRMIEVLSGKEDQIKQEGEELLETEEEKAERKLEYKKFEQMLGKEIIIAGMVTKINQKETLKGSKLGELTIEDYTDTITLTLWNEQFLEYSKFFVPNIFVIVRLKVTRNYYNKNKNLKINVLEMSLLSEVFEKKPKALTINLYVSHIDKNFIDYLYEKLKKHQGKQKLTVNLIDMEEQALSVPLHTGLGIKPDTELIQFLEGMNLRFRLN